MGLRETIGWILEGIGVFVMLVPFLFFLLSLFMGQEHPYAPAVGTASLIFLFVPCFIFGGLIALFGYFLKRPKMATAQQITRDTPIENPTAIPPPPPPMKKVAVCANCGGENDARALTCEYCGQRLRKE